MWPAIPFPLSIFKNIPAIVINKDCLRWRDIAIAHDQGGYEMIWTLTFVCLYLLQYQAFVDSLMK